MLIKIADDKYVEVDDNDQARVVVKSDEIAMCENNLQALKQNLENLPALITTDGLTAEQKEVIYEKNAMIEQQRFAWEQELERFQVQLSNLQKLK